MAMWSGNRTDRVSSGRGVGKARSAVSMSDLVS